MINIQKKLFSSKSKILDLKNLSDKSIKDSIRLGKISQYNLENELCKNNNSNYIKATRIRQSLFREKSGNNFKIPIDKFNSNNFYEKILNKNCENVIGYIPIPVGCIGPITINKEVCYIPMATTEGALVASTNRGCKALNNGIKSYVINDGMTRSPLVNFSSVQRSIEFKTWIENNFDLLKKTFNSTTKFGNLKSIKCNLAGINVYIRFNATTGDAMGMNMLGKGSSKCLEEIKKYFPDMKILSLSGNTCTDKKSSAINWINGRGKSVIAEAIIDKNIVKNVLKTDVNSLIELNYKKNLIGSSLAGSIGGFNAHASNIITSIFIATGQDPAQNIGSSNCMTLFEKLDDGNLHMSVTLPSLEVGTIGGGTGLPGQKECLKMMGINDTLLAGGNSKKLSMIISGAVLAGELSLLSALTTDDLIKAHMKLNR